MMKEAFRHGTVEREVTRSLTICEGVILRLEAYAFLAWKLDFMHKDDVQTT